MKTTKSIKHPQRKPPGWTLTQWVLAVLIAFLALTIIGLVAFLFFPDIAI
ncbi:hypothetical protein GWR56_07260 [Mucilaginibacter sp. 14171R-50]|nr:hypothetical protein [Mucilaginibacter sp. 14171R-50]QHS55345.1 hypothetical protein GWR56_07260 [Mucilaginibacter sp. 14171R-50]